MKTVYFVTEGNTDRIVIEGLIRHWLGDEDFISRHVQPPSSDFASNLVSNLSQGWRGVVSWCRGERRVGAAGRDEALKRADCLFIHIDADVALDPSFIELASLEHMPQQQCDVVRDAVASFLDGNLPANVVLCVPRQDLEAWILVALHPELIQALSPIEELVKPARHLASVSRLVRYKKGELKKVGQAYTAALPAIVAGWGNCTDTNANLCPEAVRFEREARAVLQR